MIRADSRAAPPIPHRHRWPAALLCAAAALVLSACVEPGLGDQVAAAFEPRADGVFSPRIATAEAVEPAVRIDLGRAWSSAPGALVASERRLLSEREQRIGLVNDTTLPGDNVLILRARTAEWQPTARPQLNAIVTRAGGPLPPFTRISETNLRTRTDALGTLFWVEMRMPGDVICVYALRQMSVANRLVPQGTRSIEAVLRNCVPGTADEALAPITGDRVGTPAAAAGPSGAPRMLSPLAAPQI